MSQLEAKQSFNWFGNTHGVGRQCAFVSVNGALGCNLAKKTDKHPVNEVGARAFAHRVAKDLSIIRAPNCHL